jgi:hypothetical protein
LHNPAILTALAAAASPLALFYVVRRRRAA